MEDMHDLIVFLGVKRDSSRLALEPYLQSQGLQVVPLDPAAPPSAPPQLIPIILIEADAWPEGPGDFLRQLRAALGEGVGLVVFNVDWDGEARISGWKQGVDCLLPRPTEHREIKAVVQRLYRRLAALRGSATAAALASGITGLGWRLDVERSELIHRATCQAPCPPVALTGSELRLLQLLMGREGEPCSRQAICAQLFPNDHGASRATPENESLLAPIVPSPQPSTAVPNAVLPPASMQSPPGGRGSKRALRDFHSNTNSLNTRRLDSLVSRLRSKVAQQTGCDLPLKAFRNQGYAFCGPICA
jgi:DNA-binding response OmpR family regulator